MLMTELINLSARYYEVLKAAVPEEGALADMAEYQRMLSSAISALANKDMENYDALQYVKNELEYVQSNIKNPELAEKLVDEYATRYVERSGG